MTIFSQPLRMTGVKNLYSPRSSPTLPNSRVKTRSPAALPTSALGAVLLFFERFSGRVPLTRASSSSTWARDWSRSLRSSWSSDSPSPPARKGGRGSRLLRFRRASSDPSSLVFLFMGGGLSASFVAKISGDATLHRRPAFPARRRCDGGAVPSQHGSSSPSGLAVRRRGLVRDQALVANPDHRHAGRGGCFPPRACGAERAGGGVDKGGATWFARQNHFEWMFHPLPRAPYCTDHEAAFVNAPIWCSPSSAMAKRPPIRSASSPITTWCRTSSAACRSSSPIERSATPVWCGRRRSTGGPALPSRRDQQPELHHARRGDRLWWQQVTARRSSGRSKANGSNRRSADEMTFDLFREENPRSRVCGQIAGC